MDEKKQYRVRPGFRFGAFDELGPGDVVELTDVEAQGFRDKLELVVEVAAAPSVPPPDDPNSTKGKQPKQ